MSAADRPGVLRHAGPVCRCIGRLMIGVGPRSPVATTTGWSGLVTLPGSQQCGIYSGTAARPTGMPCRPRIRAACPSAAGRNTARRTMHGPARFRLPGRVASGTRIGNSWSCARADATLPNWHGSSGRRAAKCRVCRKMQGLQRGFGASVRLLNPCQ